MVLIWAHRNVVYDEWSQQFGDEVAEALISHFPSRDLDVPVTKEFVEMKNGELRAEMHDGFASVRAEVYEGFGSLRAEIANLRAEMHDELRRLTLWIAGSVISSAGVAVGIALAVG